MVRVVIFLIVAVVLALAIGWIADRPGQFAIDWLGYRVEMSVLVGLFAIAGLTAFLIMIWHLYRAIQRSPDQVSLFFRHRRAMKGHLAITRGLIAIGAGDAATARLSAQDAARLTPDEPLTLLLTAQSAQMSGDRAAAERIFRDMLRRDDTKLLGLRGLYIEAQRRNDANDARLFAEEAAKISGGATWASQATLEYRSAAGDWVGALATLDNMRSSLAGDDYRRRRAVLLTAQALALEPGERDRARSLAIEAAKLAPGLVPAAVLAGRLLAEAGSLRKAGKILDAAWRVEPHPDIIATYANLRFGDSARERRARVKRLADKMPGHIESTLALAAAALEAKDFAAARAALADYLKAPTRRVASLMAEIEEADGDIGRSREWLSRAMRAAPDPAWTADGVISDRWLPVSPVSGRLDAFQWKVPLAEIGIERPAIEPDQIVPAAKDDATTEVVAPAELPAPPPETPAPSSEPINQPNSQSSIVTAPSSANVKVEPVAPVIPLVHAPDDPGPEAVLEHDPIPVPTSNSTGAWDRIRQLFR